MYLIFRFFLKKSGFSLSLSLSLAIFGCRIISLSSLASELFCLAASFCIIFSFQDFVFILALLRQLLLLYSQCLQFCLFKGFFFFFFALFASMKSGRSGLYFHGVLKGMRRINAKSL